MAIAYDTQHQLDHLLTSSGIDLSARNAIIKYLMDDGLLTGGTKVWVQNEDRPPPVFPPLDKVAQVLLLDSAAASVHTDSNLKVIVDTGDAQLTVKGPNDVLVVAGDDVNLIDLKGTAGNDMVIAGAGANTIGGSQGYDYGNGNGHPSDDGHNTFGGGNDGWPRGGEDPKGGQDNLWADGHNTIGGGNDGWPRASDDPKGGQDNLWGDGGHSTIGGGDDGSGDHGGTTTLMAGSGNDTLTGDHGNYLFEVGFQNEGSATITGSSGGINTVDFEGGKDTLANATITTVHGVTTVDFKDGEDYTLTNIEHLDFHK